MKAITEIISGNAIKKNRNFIINKSYSQNKKKIIRVTSQ